MTSGSLPQSFAQRLKTETASIHREAERSGFIADLIRGRASRDGYALFLRNLLPAYNAMETRLAAPTADPLMLAFADPRLRRSASLESDLASITGADWYRLPVVDAAQAYAAAIRGAANEGTAGLVAHAYARYLGDLSGGQILKPLLARNLDLPPEALTFYDFPEIADLAAAKNALRDALDGVEAESPQADTICVEAIAAFRHNIAVSEAVQANLA